MIVANFSYSTEKPADDGGMGVVKLLCLTRIQTLPPLRAYMNPR